MKSLKLIVLTGLVSLVVLVAMLEVTLRFTPLGQDLTRGNATLEPPRFLVVREWVANTIFEYSPPEIRRQNPGGEVLDLYRIETDRNGFIQPGRVHTDPDLTVAFVGGSTTECLYVQPELRFPYLTGRILEDRYGLKVNTLNAGKSGNTTMHSTLQLIAKIIPEKPDIVVVMNNANDAGVLGNYKTYWNDHDAYRLVLPADRTIERGFRNIRDALFPYTHRAVKRVRDRLSSFLHGLVADLGVRRAYAETPGAPDQKAADKAEEKRRRMDAMGKSYRSAMTQFVATAQAWDIRTVILSQPALNEGEWKPGTDAKADYLGKAREKAGLTFADFKNRHVYFNALAHVVAENQGAEYFDLANSRAWTNNELYDGLHFTDEGSRDVAEFVADRIATILHLVPAAQREETPTDTPAGGAAR